MPRPLKMLVLVAAVLVFGAVRLPVERRLDLQRRAAGLRDDAGARMSFREQVNQASLFATLGGLRSLVAAIWDLWACTAWDKMDYAGVERDYRFCQRLQPRTFYYYDRGQWMMAYNAVRYFDLSSPERSDLNKLRSEAYMQKGLDMIKEGQRFLPNDPRIFEAEGILYRDKIRPRQAQLEADAWLKAARCPGAPARDARFHIYALAHVPGREEEAEAYLGGIYMQMTGRGLKPFPTLLSMLETYEIARRTEDRSLDDANYHRLRQLYDASPPSRTPLMLATLAELERRLGIAPWHGVWESAGLSAEWGR